MDVMNILLGVAWAFVKGENQQTKHVKRGEACPNDADKPKQFPVIWVIPCCPQNGIFAEEPRQRRNTGNSQRSNKKCFVRPGHHASKTAHHSYVLDAPHPVNYTPSGKKQERL